MIFFKQYQKRIEMKRIEATIQATKIGAVSDALNDIVGGFTILEGKGRGSGARQQIRSDQIRSDQIRSDQIRSDQAEEQVQLL